MGQNNRGWRYWANLLLAAILVFLLAALGTAVGVSYRQADSYLHPRRNIPSGDLLRAGGIDYQDIELVTEDGVRLSAWYTPPENGAVILVAHGYGDRRAEDFYALFASHGYGVVAWDFRAHGKSGGDFTSLGYYEILDVKAALDFALAQPEVERVGAWGGSMGAVTMIRAAAQYPQIEVLIADSPFVTLKEELDLRVPIPVIRSLILFFAEQEAGISVNDVRPLDDIALISPRPVFIIQGMGDKMVPLNSAQRLYDAAGDPRLLWLEDDVPHLNMYAHYRTEYVRRTIDFFDEFLLSE
jgi:fermentation-respiration switch protein FrsA (DUF1100 family)